jgi:hypothetical protein
MNLLPAEQIERSIYGVRGQRVMLDSDLADIYGVSTRVLNQAVKRNKEKFPLDFVFQLMPREIDTLQRSRSHSVILKRGHNVKYLPYAFTEHGAIMAANMLRSRSAVQMSVYVVRAFVRMRTWLGERQELAEQLAALEKKLTRRLDSHEVAIVDVLRRVLQLLEPPAIQVKPRRRIGFLRRERSSQKSAVR